MYKVIIRNGSVFGTEPCSCEFVCDTTNDVSTLPTSITEGTGGKTKYDNQVCGSGSIAVVVDNGTNPKRYILDNQDIWCPQSLDGTGSNQDLSEYAKKTDLDSKADAAHTHSASDVGADSRGSAATALSEAKTYTDNAISDLINGAPTTRDTLKEISDLMDENASVVEALDAAIGSKANKTDIPTKTSELENDSGFLTEHQDLSAYAKTADLFNAVTNIDASIEVLRTDIPTKTSELENDSGFLTEQQALSEYVRIDELDAAVSSISTTLDTKAETTDIRTKTSELENDSGFLTEQQALSEYVRIDELNAALENKADKDLYSNEGINFGRKANTDAGNNSTAEGRNTTASGGASHAEGLNTTASGNNSHAEGFNNLASGGASHAEGSFTTASAEDSHAEGNFTTASNLGSHAEGGSTIASGAYSHAEGLATTASNMGSHASGMYSVAMIDGGSTSNTTGTAFVIGNGRSTSTLSNAFSVQYDGTVKAKSTITASTTADYAEFFEWLDENPDGEDRVGYFVTLDGDKIRIANSDDDYILGVVSGEPFVLGNGDCDTWNGMFLRDEFRRTIYEPAPKMEEILDDDGNPTGEYVEVEGEYEGTRPKLNPDYDHTKKYTSRFERKEWAPIGMLGVLAVRHDGTAKVNGYVTIADGGIATACDKHMTNSYRVIKSNTDTVVEIIFR